VIRIIVVDDHAVVRQGVRRILEDARDVKVVGEAGSAEEALRLARQHPCDVLVTDVTLPGRNGLELVEDMKHAHPVSRCWCSAFTRRNRSPSVR